MNHDDERDYAEESTNEAALLHEGLLEHEALCIICGSDYPVHTDTAHHPIWDWDK